MGTASNSTMGAAPQPSTKTATATTETLNSATAPPSSNAAIIQSDVPESSQKGKKARVNPTAIAAIPKGIQFQFVLQCLAVRFALGIMLKKFAQI
jgi:hypothetical protein